MVSVSWDPKKPDTYRHVSFQPIYCYIKSQVNYNTELTTCKVLGASLGYGAGSFRTKDLAWVLLSRLLGFRWSLPFSVTLPSSSCFKSSSIKLTLLGPRVFRYRVYFLLREKTVSVSKDSAQIVVGFIPIYCPRCC